MKKWRNFFLKIALQKPRMGPLFISNCLELDNLSSKESNLSLNIVLLLLFPINFSTSFVKENVEPEWEAIANLCAQMIKAILSCMHVVASFVISQLPLYSLGALPNSNQYQRSLLQENK